MRPFGFVLVIAGFLGLAYFTLAFNQWHAEEYRGGPMAAIILSSDRVCGSIFGAVTALIGGILMLLSVVEQGLGDQRRQLNEIHTTFSQANKTTIEQNDGVIRNVADLKREREALLRGEDANG